MLRQTLTRILLVCLCMTVGNVAAQTDEIPQPSDYAWGFPIRVSRESSFYTIELPLEVNQSVTDPDLRDAGVYNADGDAVPRLFLPLNDEVERVDYSQSLPILPLAKAQEEAADEIRLIFERSGDDARVEFNAGNASALTATGKPSSYIVDTRALKENIKGLELEWAPLDTGFIGSVVVEGSNDLKSWSPIGSSAVADMRQDNATILQRHVDISNSGHDYLRIGWTGMPEDWRLSGVKGIYTVGMTTVVRRTAEFGADSVDPEDGGIIFDMGGAPFVDRIRVKVMEPDSVISARVFLWQERQKRWIQASNGSFYFIGRGRQTVRNDWNSIQRTRTSRFKIVQTAGRPDPALRLEVSWRPDSLLFLAQGRAPFTLVAGSADDASTGFPQQRIFGDRSIAGLATGTRTASPAQLGPRYSLGGPASLQLSDPTDWRKLLL
ncbi:MAG: DUF3999 domain-containing protein, partial [Gammaproteobacteria bacterium]|nr:DUF3999 domain-containing protein [Gammaproteobacteria bacterium]